MLDSCQAVCVRNVCAWWRRSAIEGGRVWVIVSSIFRKKKYTVYIHSTQYSAPGRDYGGRCHSHPQRPQLPFGRHVTCAWHTAYRLLWVPPTTTHRLPAAVCTTHSHPHSTQHTGCCGCHPRPPTRWRLAAWCMLVSADYPPGRADATGPTATEGLHEFFIFCYTLKACSKVCPYLSGKCALPRPY